MTPNYPKLREWLQLKGYSSRTAEVVTRQTEDFLAWAAQENITDAGEVSYNDAMAYVKSCSQRGVAQRTIAHYLWGIRKCYDFLLSEGLVAENPVAFIRLQGIKRRVYYNILSPEELQRLYQQYPLVIDYEPGKIIPPQEQNILSRKRNKVLLGLLVYQGLRVEEIKALRVQDLHLREGTITVHSQRRTAERTLPLESQQVYELMDYLQQTRTQLLEGVQDRATDKLFVQRTDAANFYGITAKLLVHLRKRNPGIKNLDQIRASVITHWVKIYDLRKAQYLAGHRYVSSTEEYKQQVLDELQNAVTKFHPL